jgi:hypothetical protein
MSCAGELDAAEPGSIDESLTPKLQVLGHVDNVQDAVKTLSPLPSTPWYSTGLPHRLQNYMQHHHCGGSDSGDETQESLKALSSDEMDSDSHSSSSNEDTEADSFSGGQSSSTASFAECDFSAILRSPALSFSLHSSKACNIGMMAVADQSIHLGGKNLGNGMHVPVPLCPPVRYHKS